MNRAFPEMKKKLGFGLMRLPMIGKTVDYEQVNRMVDAFMARGFNYFDTATPYIEGQSEMAVKNCLASLQISKTRTPSKMLFWTFFLFLREDLRAGTASILVDIFRT
jgi:predicted aldo/keto reductase-like oxidoreductase